MKQVLKKSNRVWWLIIPALAAVLGFLFLPSRPPGPEAIRATANDVVLEDSGVFFEAIAKYPGDKSGKKVFAAILPHHLLAADLMAELLSVALASQPRTVILIGPDHFGAGGMMLAGTDRAWNTPAGSIEADQTLWDSWHGQDLVGSNNKALANDHAIYNILPFIRHYSPDSKILPLMISPRADEEYVRELAGSIRSAIEAGAVLISSVDFSHYLDGISAAQKDLETIAAIKNRDYGRLFNMGNDNLDCPACVALPMILGESIGNGEITILKNTNSGLIYSNPNAETTSYITAYYEN